MKKIFLLALAAMMCASLYAQNESELAKYRSENRPGKVTFEDGAVFDCDECGEELYSTMILPLSVYNDTLYFVGEQPNLLDITCNKVHYISLSKLPDCPVLDLHLEAFKDSLFNDNYSNGMVDDYNAKQFIDMVSKVEKAYPDGVVECAECNIDSECGIEPLFIIMNTMKKIIKYAEFFFVMKNEVGDTCPILYNKNSRTCSVKGTGPVEPFEEGVWEWDDATHYTSGDAYELELTRIVYTFMDGTKKIVPKNKIVYK